MTVTRLGYRDALDRSAGDVRFMETVTALADANLIEFVRGSAPNYRVTSLGVRAVSVLLAMTANVLELVDPDVPVALEELQDALFEVRQRLQRNGL